MFLNSDCFEYFDDFYRYRRRISGHTESINHIKISDHGEFVVTGGDDKKIMITNCFDLNKKDLIETEHRFGITSIEIDNGLDFDFLGKTQKKIVDEAYDDKINTDLKMEKVSCDIKNTLNNNITNKNGRNAIYTTGIDGYIFNFDLEKITTFSKLNTGTVNIKISLNKNNPITPLVGISSTNHIMMYDSIRSKEQIFKIERKNGKLEFRPNYFKEVNYIVTDSFGTLKLYDFRNYKNYIKNFENSQISKYGVTDAVFNKKGDHILVSPYGLGPVLYSINRCKPIMKFGVGNCKNLAISRTFNFGGPDGRYILGSFDDSRVCFWRVKPSVKWTKLMNFENEEGLAGDEENRFGFSEKEDFNISESKNGLEDEFTTDKKNFFESNNPYYFNSQNIPNDCLKKLKIQNNLKQFSENVITKPHKCSYNSYIYNNSNVFNQTKKTTLKSEEELSEIVDFPHQFSTVKVIHPTKYSNIIRNFDYMEIKGFRSLTYMSVMHPRLNRIFSVGIESSLYCFSPLNLGKDDLDIVENVDSVQLVNDRVTEYKAEYEEINQRLALDANIEYLNREK